MFDQNIWDIRLHWELFACWGVNFPVAIKHDLDVWKEAFQSRYLFWVCIIGQRDRLANGRNRATDCAIFDLVSIAVVP